MPYLRHVHTVNEPVEDEDGQLVDMNPCDTESEEIDCTPDAIDLENGKTPVDLAVKALRNYGPLSPSIVPFIPGAWYSASHSCMDGTEDNDAFFLYGFSSKELTAIHKRLFQERK